MRRCGASVRLPITRHFAVEPEFQYLRGNGRHYDLVLLPNVVWQWRTERVRPYFIGGVGLIHVRFPYFSNKATFLSGGFGTRIFVDKRWYIAPEARIGWEPHLRLTVGVGYSWRP